MDHNYVALIGRLARDPEGSFIRENWFVCKFSLAVEDRYQKRMVGSEKKEWVSRTDFLACEMAGIRAQSIANNFQAGDHIMVTGKLRQERWDAKDGKKKQRMMVKVTDWSFVDNKAAREQARADRGSIGAESGDIEIVDINDLDAPF